MILDKYVKMLVNNKNVRKINTLLNSNFISGDIIDFPIENLSKNDNKYTFRVKCDVCGNEKMIQYRYYTDNIRKYNFYTCCEKCAQVKNRMTKLELYGDENYTNLSKIQDTMMKKYGVLYPCHVDGATEKKKQKMMKKYGVENPSNSKDLCEKRANTMLRKFGSDVFFKTDYFKETTTYYRSSDNFKTLMFQSE